MINQNRVNLLFIALLCFISGLMFYFNQNVPFVYDDVYQIVKNPSLHNFFDLFSIINDPVRPSRLIQNLTFALNWTISPKETWSFHLFNILLHLLNSLLLFFLIPKLGIKKAAVQWVTTLIFFIHPLQVEAVTYIMGRPELLKTASTFILIHLYLSQSRKKWLIYLILIISLLVKETCLLTPLIFLAYDLTIADKSTKQVNFKEHLFYLSHIFFLIPLRYVINFDIHHNVVGFNLFPFFQYALSSFHYLTFYFHLFFNPAEQSIYHEWNANPSYGTILSGISVYIFCIYFVLIKRKTHRVFSFMIIFFLLSFLPNNSILQFVNPFAEYRLYQSNLFLAFFVSNMFLNSYSFLRIRYFTVFLVVSYFAVFHFLYISRWQHPMTLWNFALEKYPNSAVANINMASEYGQRHYCKKSLHFLIKGCKQVYHSFHKGICNQGLSELYLALNNLPASLHHMKAMRLGDEKLKNIGYYHNFLILLTDLGMPELFAELYIEARTKFPSHFNGLTYDKLRDGKSSPGFSQYKCLE